MENLQAGVKESDSNNLFTEGILYDVLDKIFEYLNLKDLCRAAAVCKSWHHRVDIEISKRNEITSLVLPITYESDDNDSDDDENTFKYLQNKWHFSDSLRSLPDSILLFHDKTYGFRRQHEDFHSYYTRHLKIGTSHACFETSGLSLDTQEICTSKNVGIGLALPSTTKLRVDWYVPWETDIPTHAHRNTMSRLTNKAISSLLDTEGEHNCFIFLRNQSDAFDEEEMILDSNSFLAEFANSLKQRCKPGSYSLWGGGVSEITYSGFGRNDLVWLTIIRISGLALHSWSIVLKMNLSDAEVENKLKNLRKDIHLKSNTVALAMVPSNNESFQQRLKKTEIFRKIFSNIPLVGVYEKTEFSQIGINSLDSDPHQVIEHTNSIIYLILSTE